MRWRLFILALVFITANSRAASVPSEKTWRASGGLSITSGDYGTDTNTTVTYLPFTLDRLWERASLGVVFPFIRVTSDSSVTIINGRPGLTGRPKTTNSSRESHSGLGDIRFRGDWIVLEERDRFPETALLAQIKCPTASESKGLGTGEWDEMVGLDFWKAISGPWSAFVTLGYTWTGDPPDQSLRNVWNYSFGPSYRFSKEWSGTASFEHSRAYTAGQDDPIDLVFSASYRRLKDTTLGGGIQFGLTDGSPDIGIRFTAAFLGL